MLAAAVLAFLSTPMNPIGSCDWNHSSLKSSEQAKQQHIVSKGTIFQVGPTLTAINIGHLIRSNISWHHHVTSTVHGTAHKTSTLQVYNKQTAAQLDIITGLPWLINFGCLPRCISFLRRLLSGPTHKDTLDNTHVCA